LAASPLPNANLTDFRHADTLRLLDDDGGADIKTGKTSERTPTLAQLFVPLLLAALSRIQKML
jgi:hypothetical protein